MLCVFVHEWMGSEEKTAFQAEIKVHGERAVLWVAFCPPKRSVEVLTPTPELRMWAYLEIGSLSM